MRVRGMEQEPVEFAELYESTCDDCLRIVLLHVGDRHLAHDLVAEAYTKAWMSWRKREVVTLRLLLDLDTETTARVLGIAPGTVGAHSGAGVQIGAAAGQQAGDRGLHQAAGNQTIHQPVHQVAAPAHNAALRVGLVYASQQCTGS
jgi:DNA-directed RNA polymerase specialized sigma24 family protein